jgi:hypothetical protein
MAARDIITDLTDLTFPLPVEPEFDDEDEATGWRAWADEELRRREEYEEQLRLTAENQDGYDPLLDAIEAARHTMLQAEARMRLLIAYGREFTRPRPYKLEDLAGAAGMSLSGVRTAYDNDEVAEVSKRTRTKPRRPSQAP